MPLGLLHALIDHLDSINTQQVWYADDSASGGDIVQLKKWWDKLCDLGPKFGYFPNEKKTKLLVKPGHYSRASEIFKNSNIEITSDGVDYLGGAIGSADYIHSALRRRVEAWCEQISYLAKISLAEPHAAFAAFTHGVSAGWQYFARVTNISSVTTSKQLLDQLEECLCQLLIPTFTGRANLSTPFRNLLSLPFRFGGMNLSNPSQHLPQLYSLSSQICQLLVNQYFSDPTVSDLDVISATLEQQEIKRSLIAERNDRLATYTESLTETLDSSTKYSLSLSLEKGASMWLSTLPIAAHGFHLCKSAFRDAVHLRYGWEPADTPLSCVCGHNFTIDHILSCPRGGFPSIRHNEIRDITASLLTEVCSNVTIEPHLQPLTGENLTMRSAISEPDARLDIAANGVWGGRFEKTFFDVRVFNPFSKTNMETPLPTTYRRHDNEKKRKYEHVREIEHASFTPLTFSSTGGMSIIASNFYKHLAEKIATKNHSSYPETIALIRCRICFALLRASIMCIRGARSTSTTPILASSVDLQVAETRLYVQS
jgi:hypothetical protein